MYQNKLKSLRTPSPNLGKAHLQYPMYPLYKFITHNFLVKALLLQCQASGNNHKFIPF